MARTPKPSGIKRKSKFRDSRKTILIVCEGGETEPQYFDNLTRMLGLKSVRIVGKDCGSSPMCVVNKAKELMNDQEDLMQNYGEGDSYDEVWCVIDRDQHTTLKQAIDKARGNKMNVALSVPCFEFWYLLHFRQTTKGFTDCDGVIDDLEAFISDYGKGDCPFEKLSSNTEEAIKNAKHVRKHGGGDPRTDVDKLVILLLNEAD